MPRAVILAILDSLALDLGQCRTVLSTVVSYLFLLRCGYLTLHAAWPASLGAHYGGFLLHNFGTTDLAVLWMDGSCTE